jgi:hypothetical protein
MSDRPPEDPGWSSWVRRLRHAGRPAFERRSDSDLVLQRTRGRGRSVGIWQNEGSPVRRPSRPCPYETGGCMWTDRQAWDFRPYPREWRSITLCGAYGEPMYPYSRKFAQSKPSLSGLAMRSIGAGRLMCRNSFSSERAGSSFYRGD